MNSPYTLVCYKFGKKANFYSIKFDDKELSTAEEFFQYYHEEYEDEVEAIISKIDIIANKRGAKEQNFRYESGKLDMIVALPEKGQGKKYLRLYCLRLSTTVVIIGGGAIKDPEGEKHSTQEIPELNKIIKFLKNLSAEIDARIKEKEIFYDGNDELCGNLKFNNVLNEEFDNE